MNRTYPLIVTITAVMFTGCQSTGVIPMDQDSYMIGKKDGTPGLGVSLSNKAAVYREANTFCQAKGLEVMTCMSRPRQRCQDGSAQRSCNSSVYRPVAPLNLSLVIPTRSSRSAIAKTDREMRSASSLYVTQWNRG